MVTEKQNFNSNPNVFRCFVNKLYGGLNMSWVAVILFAVATAVLTTVFLVVPVFENTSFYRMGVTFEAWIFFAVLIMANCKKPLESALKTFVFFLISQPLIYLFQVPFSWQGWNLFGYYKYWLIWTLLTLPMAFVGWYIKKKNWLSVLILLPVQLVLADTALGSFIDTVEHFPKNLVAAIFCTLQVLIYAYAFHSKALQRIVSITIPLIIMAVIALFTPQVDVTVNDYLPDEPALTENAYVMVDDPEIAEASITSYENCYVLINAHKYGTAEMTVFDNDTEYKYTIEIYDDNGTDRVKIIPISDIEKKD